MSTPTGPARPGRAAARTLIVDIAAPLTVYYVLHTAGVGDLIALSVAAVPPTGSAVYVAVRERRVNGFALAMLAAGTLSVLTALITQSPRELLIRGAWLSLPFSRWALGSLFFSRTTCFHATRALLPHRAETMDRLWNTDQRFRRAFRSITVM